MSDSDQQDADRQATGDRATGTLSIAVDVAEAARRLGVTPDAVRSRLHRGTLEGEKVDGQWRVRLPTVMLGAAAARSRYGTPGEPTGTQQDATGRPIDEAVDRQGTARAPTVDLAPLVAVVADLTRQLEERDARIQTQHEELQKLRGEEASWRTHALHLQARVEQLEQAASVEALQAGPPATGEAAESPESTATDAEDAGEGDVDRAAPRTSESVWQRLARWLAGGPR